MSTPPWILVTGGTVLDQIVQVAVFPNQNEITHAEKVQFSVGGNGSNIAVGLAKLNNKSLLYSQIGQDENGKFILDYLKKTNVDLRGVRLHPQGSTGSCLVFIEKQGSNRLITLPGVHVLQRAENIPAIPWANLNALVFAHSYLEVDLAIVAQNQKYELPIITLPGPAILHEAFDQYLPLIQKSSVLILNQKEAQIATRTTSLSKAIGRLHEHGPQIVIITRGSEGVLFSEYHHLHDMKAFSLEKSVDPTGAGDAFATGFIHSYLRESTVSEAVLFGQAISALKMGSLGSQSGLPTLLEVKMFLEQKGVEFPIDIYS